MYKLKHKALFDLCFLGLYRARSGAAVAIVPGRIGAPGPHAQAIWAPWGHFGGTSRPIGPFYRFLAATFPGEMRRWPDSLPSRNALGRRYLSLFHVERPVRLPKRLPTGSQRGEDQLAMQRRHLIDEANQSLRVEF